MSRGQQPPRGWQGGGSGGGREGDTRGTGTRVGAALGSRGDASRPRPRDVTTSCT